MGSAELGLHIGQARERVYNLGQRITSELNKLTPEPVWNKSIFEADTPLQQELSKLPARRNLEFGLIYQETYFNGHFYVDLGQSIHPIKNPGTLEDINFFGLATRLPGTEKRGDYSRNQFKLVGVAWRKAKI